MNRSETIKEIVPALIKFNSEVKKIEKDAENPYLKNKYATLDSIVKTIRPTLAENQLAIMQNPTVNDGEVTVKTLLLHKSGEWFESGGTTLKLVKNDPQGAGAGITYARRYDLSAFLSLNTGDDDDGNSQMTDEQNTPSENAITSAQVGEIKSKSMQFAKANNGEVDVVYEALGITDITQLDRVQAIRSIEKLDKWIKESQKAEN